MYCACCSHCVASSTGHKVNDHSRFRQITVTLTGVKFAFHTRLGAQQQKQEMTCIMLFYSRIDKPKALSLLLHTADISHPSKPWALHSRWTKALMEEFFRQVGNLLFFISFVFSSPLFSYFQHSYDHTYRLNRI